ncbi:heavy metal translocatin [Morchella conica CCBAS932]|uniref:Heavy metal translocatin n=1 Tax=Morchella conica CCBAS932 TaxID=1392247 RepID=A0A3N4KWY7_9PEZI|nr:heavy metal translocatin [Morchella conica CCBAS932]
MHSPPRKPIQSRTPTPKSTYSPPPKRISAISNTSTSITPILRIQSYGRSPPVPPHVTTNLLISNLHCPTCSQTINELLSRLAPAPYRISTNILDHSVTVAHSHSLDPKEIIRVLVEAEFEVDSVRVMGADGYGKDDPVDGRVMTFKEEPESGLEEIAERFREAIVRNNAKGKRNHGGVKHLENCELCRNEAEMQVKKSHGAGKSEYTVTSSDSFSDSSSPQSSPTDSEFTTSQVVRSHPNSATRLPAENEGLYEATISIGGMTCASCSNSITEILGGLPFVKSVSVNLMGGSGTVVFDAKASGGAKAGADKVVSEVEDAGFESALEALKSLESKGEEAGLYEIEVAREVDLRVDGMFCEHCPKKVIDALESTFPELVVEKPLTLESPIVRIKYYPCAPSFTLRHIVAAISSASPNFNVSVYHPPTMEERSRRLQLRERRRILIRLILCIIIAIPTFILGIVFMTLVPKNNKTRLYIEEPMWAGQATRVEWALFILSTPVMFWVADVFHRRAIREIRALWRRGSNVPLLRRFYRFGSMNLLISLGVSISYFASVALLAMSAAKPKLEPVHAGMEGMDMVAMKIDHITTYFDSTVLLTMFLLMGRFLEAYSKSKTADAVSLLGNLRPDEALLVVHASDEDMGVDSSFLYGVGNPIGEKDPSNTDYPDNRPWKTRKIDTDLLEVGDVISVVRGSSPPADGIVVSGQSQFDESSLTGESKLVHKSEGDSVFIGTINQGQVVNVRVENVGGDSMLDQIVKVVREGQTRRAPIERVADIITGYFVPVVTLLAIVTWLTWLGLGMSGRLPDSYLDRDQGGWAVWSLGFAIAVFVIACPCGIGLAAPTALFVGSGLAAKYGILVKGGGEAFQEASRLDCIVFDKTGTLTQGGEPKVTDEKLLTRNTETIKLIYTVSQKLEEGSAHPLARAVVKHCELKEQIRLDPTEIEEVPGRGLHGFFKFTNGEILEAIIGNERFMEEYGILGLEQHNPDLNSWKMAGKSVVLLAIRYDEKFELMALYSATDPIRPEAPEVIQRLQENGIGVWMISGDNPKTAVAVATMVGIPAENVIAGVLPTEKADKILHLQKNARKRPRSRLYQMTHRKKRSSRLPHRAIIAMVGDGINDAPALTVADVGIAIGSGSDIAIGSAKFILVSSDLRSLLTLTELSRTVFRRVKLNFLWACIYNLCALPIAAGVLYPAGGVRLDPVWAALAMALSSVSVVCSSLLLKTKWYGVGFRPKQERYKQ